MSTPPLGVERSGATTRLTLNRPDKANALDTALVEALLDALQAAFASDTRLLVLAGAGRNFCAGFDFGGFEEAGEAELVVRFVRIELVLQALWHAPIPTVALVHGGAFGAGADIVCACERRIATPDARFRMPGFRFGIALGTRRLAARIGAASARRVLGASSVFDAPEALALGFVDTVAAPEAWPDQLAAIERDATRLAPEARATLNRLTVHDTADADLAALVRSASAPGLKERIRAFRAERG